MSDSIIDRVTGILEDAEQGSDELGALEEVEDLRGALEESGLVETAQEASDLMEDDDADELLEALGLDELEDGTEPDSLLDAIARGSAEQVGDLRVLVKLAKVAEADDEELSTEVGELREAVEERAGVLGEKESETDEDDEADEEDAEGEEESLAESAVDAVQDAVGNGEEDDDENGTGILGEQIESAMRSRLEGFGDELDEARAHLDSLREDDEGKAEDPEDEESRDDEARAEDPENDEARAKDPEDEETRDEREDDEDTGPLGSDSRPRSRGTMHSTMAPSPSKRADMGTSTRHSTMPNR